MSAATGNESAAALSSAEAFAIASRYGLREMGVRPGLRDYVRDVFHRFSFIRVLATSKAYAKNQNSYLGQFWNILNPTLNALVYIIIFGFVLSASRGLDNSIAFITTGVFAYRFFDQAVLQATRSIDSNLGLVRSHTFPRAVIPASTVLTGVTLFIPTTLVMMVFTWLSGLLPKFDAALPTWRLFELPVAVALFTVFNAGCAFFVARLGAGSPDLANVLPFILRFGMYVSGVMFPISHYVHITWLTHILDYQPVAVFIYLVRMAVLDEPAIPFDWYMLLWGIGWAAVALVIGFVYFWRAEETYGRD